MKIVGLMPVRNEDWVLGLSARAALTWCDELVILLHACNDRSREITEDVASENPGRVHVFIDPEDTWKEMEHRQKLLDLARARSASHLALVDSDEVLTGNLISRVRRWIEETPQRSCLQFPMFCMRNSIWNAHSSGIWGHAMVSFAFEDDSAWHWTNQSRGGYDYHHRHPMGYPFVPFSPIHREVGGVMHLQFVNQRRLAAKQALYKMQEVTRWPGRSTVDSLNFKYNPAVYGTAVPGTIQEFQRVPESFWQPYADLRRYLRLDESIVPWQEVECERLWRLHGAATFTGLDLFGVTERFKASPAVTRLITPTDAPPNAPSAS